MNSSITLAVSPDLLSAGPTRGVLHPNETDTTSPMYRHHGIKHNEALPGIDDGVGSNTARTMEFWAKLDNEVLDRSKDRIAWELVGGLADASLVQLGFHGPAHVLPSRSVVQLMGSRAD